LLKSDELLVHPECRGVDIFSCFVPKYQLGGWVLGCVMQCGTVRQLERLKGRKKLGGKAD